ncbi:glycoside hydrolase family 18 protein [Mycena floridula]|nr:glycoside hydrolase family 18 protein [Mycena floridula]
MVGLSVLVSTTVALLSSARALGTPVNSTSFDGLGPQARDILARATPAAPHFVVYGDQFVSGVTGPPPVSQVTGFNVFALSFLLLAGAWDKAAEWTSLNPSDRATIKAQYAAAGSDLTEIVKLVVSVFGSSDIPTSSGADPIATANTMAQWVIQWGLDGIDDFDAMNAGDGKAVAWLINFTKQLRVLLPQDTYILTHAPVAPWFSAARFPSGYLTVHNAVGSMIDWYNVQFYNQGVSEYTTCDNLLTTSSSTWPNSALFQIAASGVPLSKLVIGKPSAAGGGFMSASTLATCLQSAKAQGWTGGAMVWEYPGAQSAWITTVRSLSWPVTSTGTTTSATSTGTSSPGTCNGVAAWSSTAIYTGGLTATYNGKLWTAQWWTEGDVPGGAAGVWVVTATC